MSLGDILTLPIQRNYIEREARCIILSLQIRAAAQPVAFSNVGRTGFRLVSALTLFTASRFPLRLWVNVRRPSDAVAVEIQRGITRLQRGASPSLPFDSAAEG